MLGGGEGSSPAVAPTRHWVMLSRMPALHQAGGGNFKWWGWVCPLNKNVERRGCLGLAWGHWSQGTLLCDAWCRHMK